jgi:hypothetical protein
LRCCAARCPSEQKSCCGSSGYRPAHRRNGASGIRHRPSCSSSYVSRFVVHTNGAGTWRSSCLGASR